MSHYDDAYEEHYAEQRRATLAAGRKTIVARLELIAGALRTLLGTNLASSVIEEAIQHLKNAGVSHEILRTKHHDANSGNGTGCCRSGR